MHLKRQWMFSLTCSVVPMVMRGWGCSVSALIGNISHLRMSFCTSNAADADCSSFRLDIWVCLLFNKVCSHHILPLNVRPTTVSNSKLVGGILFLLCHNHVDLLLQYVECKSTQSRVGCRYSMSIFRSPWPSQCSRRPFSPRMAPFISNLLSLELLSNSIKQRLLKLDCQHSRGQTRGRIWLKTYRYARKHRV